MAESYQSLKDYQGLEPIDKFGKFLMEHLRDVAILHCEKLTRGEWSAPALAKLQSNLGSLSNEQKVIINSCIVESIDTAIHDFLFKLQEQADFENVIQVLVAGKNIVGESREVLHWEPFGEDGWFAKYSAYGEPTEYQLDEGELEDTLDD